MCINFMKFICKVMISQLIFTFYRKRCLLGREKGATTLSIIIFTITTPSIIVLFAVQGISISQCAVPSIMLNIVMLSAVAPKKQQKLVAARARKAGKFSIKNVSERFGSTDWNVSEFELI